MKKELQVAVLLLLVCFSFAQDSSPQPEKTIWSKILELLSVASNPTFNNNKYNPLEKHHSLNVLPADPNGESDARMLVQVSSRMKGQVRDPNQDPNIEVETLQQIDVPQTDENGVLLEENNTGKFKLFRGPDGKIFKEQNLNTFVGMQMRDDNNNNNQDKGPSVDDSKTAKSIDALNAQIKEDVEKATEDMKADMKKNNEDMKDQLTAATDQLNKEIYESEKNITKEIKHEAHKTNKKLAEATHKITHEIDIVALKQDENLVQTLKMKLMTLEEDISRKSDELDNLNHDIDELKSQIPPPKTICDTFFDCGTCTKNPKCGWCIAEEKCVEGDKVGPLHTSCNFYDYGVCSGGGCSRYKDCSSCIGDPMCGYCGDNEKCLQRPGDFSGCKPGLWFHSQGTQPMCPLPEVTTADPLSNSGPTTVGTGNGGASGDNRVQLTNQQEKDEIRKKQEELIRLQNKAAKLQIEIDTRKKEHAECAAQILKYEAILEAAKDKLEGNAPEDNGAAAGAEVGDGSQAGGNAGENKKAEKPADNSGNSKSEGGSEAESNEESNEESNQSA